MTVYSLSHIQQQAASAFQEHGDQGARVANPFPPLCPSHLAFEQHISELSKQLEEVMA